MIALIDGDICVHRVGYTTENEDYGIARWRMNAMIESILEEVGADAYMVFLSDSTENGWRKEIYPEYKANRTAPKPKHYDALKEYLILEWDASITSGEEADDRLGIIQMDNIIWEYESDFVLGDAPTAIDQCNSIICSIDKDLKQIPGLHYNFVKKEFDKVYYNDGLRFFYQQILTGDVSDNVKGLRGIGPKRAEKLLGDSLSEEALLSKALEAYRKKGISDEEFLRTAQVLKIRTKEGEIWQFPDTYTGPLRLQDTPLSSTQSSQEGTDQSTEPTTTESLGYL